jgi:hypothetical protein
MACLVDISLQARCRRERRGGCGRGGGDRRGRVGCGCHVVEMFKRHVVQHGHQHESERTQCAEKY